LIRLGIRSRPLDFHKRQTHVVSRNLPEGTFYTDARSPATSFAKSGTRYSSTFEDHVLKGAAECFNAFRLLEVFRGLADEAAYVIDWYSSLTTIGTASTCQGIPHLQFTTSPP
jgi:hypothetical protein